MMLRIDEYRFAFVSVDGISTLLSVLSGRVNFQVRSHIKRLQQNHRLFFCLIRSNTNWSSAFGS